MTKTIYKRAFKAVEELQENLHQKVKQSGTSIDSSSVFGVTDEGVELRTEYYCCGDTDVDYVKFTWDEVFMDEATWKAHQTERKRLAQEAAKAKKAQDKLNAERAKEVAERKKYEELRAKFEAKPSVSAEDVVQVAKSVNVDLTVAEVKQVIEDYPSAQADDPTGTWNLVVENQIHNLKNNA